MAPPQLSSNTAPILALVGAEIFSLMAFVGVCEARATDIALCESRWSLALPAIALAGQSAATYFGTPEKDSRPIRAEFVRLLRVNQAGKRSDIKWARSQKAGLQMTAGALIADQAIRKL